MTLAGKVITIDVEETSNTLGIVEVKLQGKEGITLGMQFFMQTLPGKTIILQFEASVGGLCFGTRF